MTDHYHLISTISSDERGTLSRAYDRSHNRDVTFRRIPLPPEGHAAFNQAARDLYALRDKAVTTVYDYGTDAEGAWLVSGKLQGESLSALIERAPLNEEQFVALVRQSLEVLAAAHERGLIHRGLNPDTVFVPWNGKPPLQIRLTDFVLAPPEFPVIPPIQARTQAVASMAPEQFASGMVDGRTDLYSLGTVLYEALTQQKAFKGDSAQQLIIAHLQHKLTPLQELRPEMPPSYCGWVERLLNLNPIERPQSAAEALALFEHLIKHEQTVVAAAILPDDEEEAVATVLADTEDDEEPQYLDSAPLPSEPEIETEAEEANNTPAPSFSSTVAEETEPSSPAASDQPNHAPEATVEEEPPAPTFTEPPLSSSEERHSTESEEAPSEPNLPAPQATTEEPPHYTETAAWAGVEPTLEPEVESTQTPTAPLSTTVAPVFDDAPQPKAATNAPTGRKSRLKIEWIVGVFAIFLILQIVGGGYVDRTQQKERLQRLSELQAEEQPHGSDLDVRMLLKLFDDTKTREQAALILSRLRGGDYIDDMLVDHLNEIRQRTSAVRYLEILGLRQTTAAFPTVLHLAQKEFLKEVRVAGWQALSQITPTSRFAELLQALDGVHQGEREIAERAVATAVEKSDDKPKAMAALVQAFDKAQGQASLRNSLLNIFSRVGGPEAIEIVKQAIADPSISVRLTAIPVLAEYPTHDLLPVLAARFPEEPDQQCRIYLIVAATQLITQPGPLSQHSLFQQAHVFYEHAKTPEEKSRALKAISRITSPGTAEFFESFRTGNDPALAQEAAQVARTFRMRLTNVVAITPDNKMTPAPAETASFHIDSGIKLEKGALANWTHTTDWAAWLLQFPQSGEYEIALYQAHASANLGTYEVLVAGQTLTTAVVKTANDQDFKGFVVGKIQIDQPGIYRLQLRPKQIPPTESLFTVRNLAIRKL